MQPSKLRIALAQCDIADLNPEENLLRLTREVEQVAEQADLIVFPEAINTGFSDRAANLSEPWEEGPFSRQVEALARTHNIGIAGSIFIEEPGEKRRNRFFLASPERLQWQDKRHLFALGGEPDLVHPAEERRLVTFRGWRILPIVCYDLRFPVWCRCLRNDYDLIICVANWPRGRRSVWSTLLMARAMENLAYVVGVNRIGKDLAGLEYTGDSAIINPRGQVVASATEGLAETIIGEITYPPLAELRSKFPVWQDADAFTLID